MTALGYPLVVGFDPGLRQAGWGLLHYYEPSNKLFIDCGLIKTPGQVNGRRIKGDRALAFMAEAIKNKDWRASRYVPDLLVVEGQDFHGRKGIRKVSPQDISRIASVSGMFAVAQPAIRIAFVQPSVWTRGIPKEKNQALICRELGETPESLAKIAGCTVKQTKEVIDALGMALWGLKRLENGVS